MYPELEKYIETVKQNMDSVPVARKELLKEIAGYIGSVSEAGTPAQLVFICTHNSRRSHLSQVWAATAAAHYGLENKLQSFSGGTEATAFNPRAVAALERAGFQISNPGGENPKYRVRMADNGREMTCFSKIYDDPANPSQNFAALMTCSEADENCPFIPGADLRVAIPYVDPKEADGTENEAKAYDDRCLQIATEMFYMMSIAGS